MVYESSLYTLEKAAQKHNTLDPELEETLKDHLLNLLFDPFFNILVFPFMDIESGKTLTTLCHFGLF